MHFDGLGAARTSHRGAEVAAVPAGSAEEEGKMSDDSNCVGPSASALIEMVPEVTHSPETFVFSFNVCCTCEIGFGRRARWLAFGGIGVGGVPGVY